MIIVRLQGGLGNQMFQYAAARCLSEYHKTEMQLDTSFYDSIPPNTTPRQYKLRHFNIKETFASQENIQRLASHPFNNTPKGILYRILRKLRFYQPTIFWERDFTRFDKNFFSTPRDVYLDGYWGNEKYFSSIADLIRGEFAPKFVPSEKGNEIAGRMHETASVSLHVRRGDYVALSSKQTPFHLIGLDYYITAIQYIHNIHDNINVFVFSDDPNWAETNLKLEMPTTFVTHNDSVVDYEDLWLMSQCKYHIIANSTFSWWGAWLSSFSDKIVVAPKNWYSPQSGLTLELPLNWIKL